MVVSGDRFDGVWEAMDPCTKGKVRCLNQIATAATCPVKKTMVSLMHDNAVKNDNGHGHGARVFTSYEDRQRYKSIKTLSIYIGIHNFFQ